MSLGEEFRTFTSKKYSDQAIAFLNAYWDEVNSDKEIIWGQTHQFIELDHEKGKEGRDLDEFNAHRFLEKLGETKTVKQMRDELKEIDMDFNKRMALIEYFLWAYKKSVSDFVSKPQGTADPEEIATAQRLLDEVQKALAESQAAADIAQQREKEALEAEAPFKKAQEELLAAIAEVKKQEEDYKRRTDTLRAKSEDMSLGVVQRNKASNELAQLLAQDPLPLRQAKISLEAAERKAEKLRKPFKEARELAEKARAEADEAVDECNRRYEEAEKYLQEVMSKSTSPHGQIWWFERELEETKKYMPSKRR
jgi:DNA repair exonuclease SbcCD ATPase subunit